MPTIENYFNGSPEGKAQAKQKKLQHKFNGPNMAIFEKLHNSQTNELSDLATEMEKGQIADNNSMPIESLDQV